MKRQLFRNRPKKTVVVGIAGTHSGCGTTHFALCAANYLSNVAGNHVMVSSHCADALKNNILKRQAKVIHDDVGNDSMIVYANITFMAGGYEASQTELCVQYDYYIVDFGQMDCVGEYELQYCDRLFLAGDLSLWRFDGSIKSAESLKRRYAGTICFMSAFYSVEGMKAYKKAVKEQPVIIPIDMEPFAISRDTLLLMERLFGEEAYGISSKIKK